MSRYASVRTRLNVARLRAGVTDLAAGLGRYAHQFAAMLPDSELTVPGAAALTAAIAALGPGAVTIDALPVELVALARSYTPDASAATWSADQLAGLADQLGVEQQ